MQTLYTYREREKAHNKYHLTPQKTNFPKDREVPRHYYARNAIFLFMKRFVLIEKSTYFMIINIEKRYDNSFSEFIIIKKRFWLAAIFQNLLFFANYILTLRLKILP